jgi:hypothetical protein
MANKDFEIPLKKFLEDNKGKNFISYKTPEFSIDIKERYSTNFINKDEKVISPDIVDVLDLSIFTELDFKIELIIDFFENYCKENNKVLTFPNLSKNELLVAKDEFIDILIKRNYKFIVAFKKTVHTWDFDIKNIYSSDEFKHLEYKKHQLFSAFKLGNVKIIIEDKKEKIYTDEEALIQFKEDFKINLDSMITSIIKENDKEKKYGHQWFEKFYNNYGKFKINLQMYSQYQNTSNLVNTEVGYKLVPHNVRSIKIIDFFSVSHYIEIYEYILQTLQKVCQDNNIVIISYVNKEITEILVKKGYSFKDKYNNKATYTSEEFENLSETEKNTFYSHYYNEAFNLLNILVTKEKQPIQPIKPIQPIQPIQSYKNKKKKKKSLEEDEDDEDDEEDEDDEYEGEYEYEDYEGQGEYKENLFLLSRLNTQHYYNSEINAFESYSGNAYKNLNITFKTTGYPNQSNYELYLNLWNIIDRNPLLEDIVVYRGVPDFNKTWYTNEWNRENNTISEIEESKANLRCFPSYFSASTSKDIAISFAGANGCVMTIHLKKGDRAFEMAKYSSISSEKEVLVAPGQLKIIKVPQKDSKGMINVECNYSNISDRCFNSIGINKLKPLIEERENHVCSFKNNECGGKLLFCTETEKYFCESHHNRNCIDIFNYDKFENFIKFEKYDKINHKTYDIESLIKNIGELNDKPLIINLNGVKTIIEKLPFNDSIMNIPKVVDFKTLKATKNKVQNSTGETRFYIDPNNKRYIVKLAVARNNFKEHQPFRAVAQEIFSQVSSVVRPRKYVPVVQIKGGVNGMPATVQPFIEHSVSLDTVIVSKLSFMQKKDIAEEHMLDWLLSQHDTHIKNLLIRPDGHIVSIDKEQGFKYFMGDFKYNNILIPTDTELSIDYHPNSIYGEKEPYYNNFWRAFRDKIIDFDPTVIKPVLKRIENIPKSDYIKVLHKFAISKYTDKNTIKKFIDLGLKRKNDIRNDFETFISNLYIIRTGKKGTFTFENGWKIVNKSSTFGMRNRNSKKSSIRKKSKKSSIRKKSKKSSIRKKSKKSSIRKKSKKSSIRKKNIINI